VTTPSNPDETRIKICSFCSTVLKLTVCWLPSKSLSVPTAMGTERLVRPSSIQGGKYTEKSNSSVPAATVIELPLIPCKCRIWRSASVTSSGPVYPPRARR
jgi:hypothetical protein